MFVDASALVAILSNEPEAERISNALIAAQSGITSPVAVLETVIALARPDKFNQPILIVEKMVLEFLDARGIEIRDLPPAQETSSLAVLAASRYRVGRHKLNLGDCLHYACAKHYDLAILATADEFRQTDLTVVP